MRVARIRSRQPAVDTGPGSGRASGEGEGLTPEGYAAACTWAALAPLGVRAGLLGFLSAFELAASEHREAVRLAHLSGLMVGGTLTPQGVQAARLALEAATTPPQV